MMKAILISMATLLLAHNARAYRLLIELVE